MYKIFKNNELLAVVSNPAWIKKQDNGVYALCNKADAHGVVVDGTVFHVMGLPEIEGVDTVIIGEIDEAAYYKEQKNSLNDTLCKLSTDSKAKLAAMEDALCEIDGLLNGGENNE